jgi:hypothetical protein
MAIDNWGYTLFQDTAISAVVLWGDLSVQLPVTAACGTHG